MIKGLAHYVNDIRLPDTLHVAFVRSMYAHARINGIDTTAAAGAPGVVAVYTGKDIAAVGPVPCAAALPDLKVPDYRVLATGKALFVGHPIAAVVATDKYAARDAVDLIEVDYEDLPAVVDVEAAATGGPVIHESFGDNIAYKLTSGEGDVEAALQGADRIVTQKMIHQRLAPIAMEPRGVLARYFPGEEELTIWSSTQIPHLLRTQLAIMIGVPENKLRVITPEVGGGFGSKLNVYAEEALLGWISIQLGKPVKWIESRRETCRRRFTAARRSAPSKLASRTTARSLDCVTTSSPIRRFISSTATLTPAIPTLTGLMLSGAYRFRDSDERDRRLHQQDVDGRLSRRGRPRGDLRRRARHGCRRA
jgi:carbon-monoxide dehydrogenase large subunit